MDINAIKRKMLVKYPFFGSVVANVGYKENKDIKTAGTDGKTIFYNRKYLESLSKEEQIFIFAHEVCHIAFNHILRSEGKDHELWNIATDGVINQFLKRDGLTIVKGGVDLEEAINYDAEKLYEILLEKKRQQLQSGNGSDEEKHEDVGHDTHSMWEQAIKKQKNEQKKSGGKESIQEELLGKDQKEKNELANIDEKEAFKRNLEERKKQLKKLKEAISEQASQAGTTTNSDVRKISDIGTAKPIVDWRYILREAIKYDVDWSYRNATLENGVVVANWEKQPMPETEIVLDTSGSINEILLKNFLRECKNILQHTKLKVGCFDTKFYGFHEIRTEEDIENMEFVGGGGTNFNAAVNAFTKRVENKIIFTDGEASMPSNPLDAIWIVFGEKTINPKGGKVIHITPEQLDRLYSYIIETKDGSRQFKKIR